MHVYLFEAKSIQAYIFKSGKLKDLIAASERLDRLVDDREHSTLNRVLESAGLESNLLDADKQVEGEVIGFTRCKGGAFYAFCVQAEPLEKLRRLWTLTVLQLFPGLEFTDALTQGVNLSEAMAKGHSQMAMSRNAPTIKFPIATAVCSNAPRSGLAAVPVSSTAQREMMSDAKEYIDIDTEHHRQAYHLLELRKDTLLGKFTGDALPDDISFPLDIEDFPAFKAADGERQVVRDLALIHVDGNGIGLILRQLQKALQGKADSEFSGAFRQFSTALGNATQAAAIEATKWLYESNLKNHPDNNKLLPMRPIVLGGDDITVLCQADLAIGYAERFCEAFKKFSEQELKSLHNKYLKNTELKPYLTASGGVLYHKASHPFVTCHQLVEGLCDEAKLVTKAVDKNVGPAALSFYRISNILAEDMQQLREMTQSIRVAPDKPAILSSLGGYLLEAVADRDNSLPKLREMADLARKKKDSGVSLPISIAKLRQMHSHLASGDVNEAKRIHERAKEQQQKQRGYSDLDPWLSYIDPWLSGNGDKSGLADLLIYAHFNQPEQMEVDNG